MLLKKKIIPAMLGAFVSLGLVACGSDSDTTVGVGATTEGGGTNSGASSSSAHTIVLSYPYLEAITDEGNGIYRRVGEAIVTNNKGIPVPDGTRVDLSVIDSILATGIIDSGDSVTGAVLTDLNPMQADGTDTTFDVASIVRNNEVHFIESTDPVLLFSSDASDRSRVIAPGDGMITANTLTVTSDYSMPYPDSSYYPEGQSSYVVGVSSLGAHVLGTETETDDTGAETVTVTGNGYSLTKNGLATFYVVYPANANTINTGCVDPALDTRVSPAGSARVYMIASAGTNATTVDENFCFVGIANGTLTASPSTDLSGSGSVNFTLRDGGNSIRSPFREITTSIVQSGTTDVVLSGGFEVDNGFDDVRNTYKYRTDEGGRFTSTIMVVSPVAGDTVEITYSTAENQETTTVTVTIPEDTTATP